MIAVRGSSVIVERLIPLLPDDEKMCSIPRGEAPPLHADRYFFCQGLLRAKTAAEQTDDDRAEGMAVNAWQIIDACDTILAVNHAASICVMGSESGFSGSYDGTYAVSKRKLHRYVEMKQLRSPDQQLVCVAPGIIEDCGMTTRRRDHARLVSRRDRHPKRRFLGASDVAKLVHYLLYVDRWGYISGTVIRIHGGEAACR